MALSVECSDATEQVLSQLFQSYFASFGQWYGSFVLVCLALYLLWRYQPARGAIACIAVLSLLLWAVIGDPMQTVADWLWPGGPAPG
jgi:hypothetical protein